MADDKKKRGGADRGLIALSEPYEVAYWSKKFKVTPAKLKAAVGKAGRSAKNVEAYFKLNTISGGKGVSDGVVQYWFDGQPTIDHRNVLLRTGANPTMQFNQIVLAPYIGDGSPVAQSMWIDNLTVGTGRP